MGIKNIDKRTLELNATKLMAITKLALDGRYINISEVVITKNTEYAVEPTMYLRKAGYVNLSGCRSPFTGKTNNINQPIPNGNMTTGEYARRNVTTTIFQEVFGDAAIGGLHYGMLLRAVKWDKEKLQYIQAQLESVIYKI